MSPPSELSSLPYLVTENRKLELSVIIVSYQVRYFLEQCLHTVLAAAEGLDAEVIVTDNASADGSLAFLQPLFPSVRFIQNSENLGFAKANNEALKYCSGKWVLFLNPDTLVPKNALRNCLAYLQQHPAAGALGVRMLDGRGRFLPESKRSFPSPWVSFCKLSGLAALFPASHLFNRYALGYLDERRDHVVPVLAGAFLMVNKEVLNQLQGFDETYFLYGEDIDLSYRIQKAGYENHYFAGTSILHFKGESSAGEKRKRDRFFYRAMQVFVTKHYHSGSAKVFSGLLQVAIHIRSLLAGLHRFSRSWMLPLTDGLLLLAALHLFRLGWVIQFRNGKDFGVDALPVLIPFLTCCFIGAAACTGLYEQRLRISRLLLSLIAGQVFMLAAYALLPEQFRFSRGVVLGGGLLGLWLLLLRRILFTKKWTVPGTGDARTLVVANAVQYASVSRILAADSNQAQLVGRVGMAEKEEDTLGTLSQLPQLVTAHAISQIIFCVDALNWNRLTDTLAAFKKNVPIFLFYTSGSHAIISSQARPSGVALVTPETGFSLANAYQQRMKRIVDLFFSLLFLLGFPLHLLIHPHPIQLLKQVARVLNGKKTWVGYSSGAEDLPALPDAVITSRGAKPMGEAATYAADRFYARHYDWWNDVNTILKYYRQLS